MRIARIKIQNFRGIKSAELLLPRHVVFVGDNNTGKSTVLEAIDLVLGPERLQRPSPIDEHDFYAGEYLGTEEVPKSIKIEVVVIDLSDEQRLHFGGHIEWWNSVTNALLEAPPPEETDKQEVSPALRLGFEGQYDADEDSFVGNTFFMSPEGEDGQKDAFRTRDKRLCGFLFLRTLRSGSRALSMERGSLLDIILRLQEKRFTMWEDVLTDLRKLAVAEKEELGVTTILEEVQSAVRKFVPADWAENPNLRVSDLTREHLRKTLTVFMGTGAKNTAGAEYAAPFSHQGTGTINTLVLALLSMIAEQKQNVIFAMEEPEIAIPPHTQRRIVDSVRDMAAQAIFTSHSPYVLDEFPPDNLVILTRTNGVLEATTATLPPAVKGKAFREELRTRFCECLLARKVLIAEGRTEYDAIPAAARRLHSLVPERFKSLESLGVAIIDAETDSQIARLGVYFKGLGKVVFAISDHQERASSASIAAAVDLAFESPESSFEKLILNHTAEGALRRFGRDAVVQGRWPEHLAAEAPHDGMALGDLKSALGKFFKKNKGASEAAILVADCNVDEMPEFLVAAIEAIRNHCISPAVETPTASETAGAAEEAAPEAVSSVEAPMAQHESPREQ